MNQRVNNRTVKRTVNLFLLGVTVVVVPTVSVGAYVLRQSQMPRIATQFLRLADVEVEHAKAADIPANRASHYHKAANFVYRYIQLTGRNPVEESRMLDLWNSYVAELPNPSRMHEAGTNRQIDLYFQLLGTLEVEGEAADEIAKHRIDLLQVLDDQQRLIDQKQQAEILSIYDLPADDKRDSAAIRAKVHERVDSLTLNNLVEHTSANPHFPTALAHLAKAMWRMALRDSLPLEDEDRLSPVLRLAWHANPTDDTLAMQYALLIRDHRGWLREEDVGGDLEPTRLASLADSVMDQMVERESLPAHTSGTSPVQESVSIGWRP